MSLSIVYSRAAVGTEAPVVTVEVHLSRGLPSCSVVGLPETAVKESRDRVRGAIQNAGFEFPRQRIIVNLAPADLPKEGGRFDLPIALGILIASGQVKARQLEKYVFLGELALSGELREIRGALIAALSIRDEKSVLVLPSESAAQAALAENVYVQKADSLGEVCAALNGIAELDTATAYKSKPTPDADDLSDVMGHQFAKRAMEIAAAGHHSLLLKGPPGAGKTMLANRLPGILPPMTEQEALESAAILSLSHQGFDADSWKRRPFRSPHHSASGAAVIGGGSIPAPGEVSLAHHGVLFLDEIPEFNRQVLELLREPMESGRVLISRATRQSMFLSDFLLIATANSCPCGYFGDDRCQCRPEQVAKYQSKLSGPLLDRIDIHLNIQVVNRKQERRKLNKNESSKTIQQRVVSARERQLMRQGKANSQINAATLKSVCALYDREQTLLDTLVEQYRLSSRAADRLLKLSRTIADLRGCNNIEETDLLEAVAFRCKNFRH